MNEKEKRDKGLLYYYDDQLIEEINRGRELCFKYNSINPSCFKEKEEMIRNFFGRTGNNFLINGPIYFDFGYNIEIGNNFFSNMNLTILDEAKVTFGDNVFIAPNCGFYTAGHPLDVSERNKGLEYAKEIKVGNNVWIGANVVVLPGVTIGDNSVIGAGSVVTKDIPSNVLAYGNPCRVIKNIDNKKEL